jgi:hypothetical protein
MAKVIGKIAFDTKRRRPGCVLLQAALGGDPHIVREHFDGRTWLVDPSPDMRVYQITDEQLPLLVEMAEKAAGTI